MADLGRYDDALEQLPASIPENEEDWIGYHIRGMILLKTGQVDAARQIFEDGMQRCPFANSLDYFRAGLSIAHLSAKRYQDAQVILVQIYYPLLRDHANLLEVHAHGADQQYERARQVYDLLPEEPRTPSGCCCLTSLTRR